MEDKLIEKEKYNRLFDYYHMLLTEKQKVYYQMYYFDDYSLGEIAEYFKLSRNAIYDQIKTVLKLLVEYEDKLHLVRKDNDLIEIIKKLESKYQDELFEELKKIL